MKHIITVRSIIPIVILCAMMSGCAKNNDDGMIVKLNNPVDSIIATLDACPYWVETPKDDLATRERITNIYIAIGKKYDNETIRDASAKIYASRIHMPPTETPEESRLREVRSAKCHALFRVLFDIPPGFWPWLDGGNSLTSNKWGVYNPTNKTENLLAPFEVRQGKLFLTGGKKSVVGTLISTGPEYDPVLEFIVLSKIYDRRTNL